MELNAKKFDELTNDELYGILKLRATVFVVEQGITYVDMDGLDKGAYHIFFTEEGEITAYLRILDKGVLYDEVCIGRVISTKRRCGLGSKLLSEGIKVAREKFGAEKIIIGAQTYAKPFYEKQGFRQISEEYYEESIPHIKMLLE